MSFSFQDVMFLELARLSTKLVMNRQDKAQGSRCTLCSSQYKLGRLYIVTLFQLIDSERDKPHRLALAYIFALPFNLIIIQTSGENRRRANGFHEK
jgi:hypothetical protein